jgi:hypothetical protein
MFRTAHLTDINVQHQREKRENEWEDVHLEEEVHYENLDEVDLPTDDIPVYKLPTTRPMSEREMMDAISQAVAESAWERRYRLERPHAQQRIKMHCNCKYCKHPNTYQTLAYRKKWLIQQGLWKDEKTETTEVDESAEKSTQIAREEGGAAFHMQQNSELATFVDQEIEDGIHHDRGYDGAFESIEQGLDKFEEDDNSDVKIYGDIYSIIETAENQIEIEETNASSDEHLEAHNEHNNKNAECDIVVDSKHDKKVCETKIGEATLESITFNSAREEYTCPPESSVSQKPEFPTPTILDPKRSNQRQKNNFLFKIGVMLGFVRANENDTFPKSKARKRQRNSRKYSRAGGSSIFCNNSNRPGSQENTPSNE